MKGAYRCVRILPWPQENIDLDHLFQYTKKLQNGTTDRLQNSLHVISRDIIRKLRVDIFGDGKNLEANAHFRSEHMAENDRTYHPKHIAIIVKHSRRGDVVEYFRGVRHLKRGSQKDDV